MQEIFQQWPTVKVAHELIRRTRSERYFAPWDSFSKMWSGALGVPEHIALLTGPNLGAAIDTVFEQEPPSEHARLAAAFEAAATLDEARAILPQTPTTLVDALRNQIAFATIAGYEQSGAEPALAREWLHAWAEAIHLHAAHQIAHEEAIRAAHQAPELHVASFEEAIEIYTKRFTRTDAFATSMVAVFPFVSFASEPMLQTFVELSDRIARFMRLLGDVVYNPEETINAGLFALSVTEGISLAQALQRVRDQQPAPRELQQRVAEVALKQQEELGRELAQVLQPHASTSEHVVLSDQQPARRELQPRVSSAALEQQEQLGREHAQAPQPHAGKPEHVALGAFFQVIQKVSRRHINAAMPGAAQT